MQHDKPGKKRRLYFYRHAMDKLWRSLLIFEFALWVAWWFAVDIPAFRPPIDLIFSRSAFVVLALVIIALLMRNGAFVQVHDDHLLIKMGFYRLEVPFDLVDTMRYSELNKALAGAKLSRSERRFIQGYRANAPVATLLLKKYPKPERVLRMFIPKYMFLPQADGFLLYIPDTMDFNTEFDSRFTGRKGAGGEVYIPQPSTVSDLDQYDDSPGLYNLFED